MSATSDPRAELLRLLADWQTKAQGSVALLDAAISVNRATALEAEQLVGTDALAEVHAALDQAAECRDRLAEIGEEYPGLIAEVRTTPVMADGTVVAPLKDIERFERDARDAANAAGAALDQLEAAIANLTRPDEEATS